MTFELWFFQIVMRVFVELDHSLHVVVECLIVFFFFSSRRRHTRYWRDWSSDVCSSDLDDHVRADVADRLLEVHLAAVDLEAAGVLDRLGDVLRGDGAEEAAVVARLLGRSEERRGGEEVRFSVLAVYLKKKKCQLVVLHY